MRGVLPQDATQEMEGTRALWMVSAFGIEPQNSNRDADSGNGTARADQDTAPKAGKIDQDADGKGDRKELKSGRGD